MRSGMCLVVIAAAMMGCSTPSGPAATEAKPEPTTAATAPSAQPEASREAMRARALAQLPEGLRPVPVDQARLREMPTSKRARQPGQDGPETTSLSTKVSSEAAAPAVALRVDPALVARQQAFFKAAREQMTRMDALSSAERDQAIYRLKRQIMQPEAK